MLGYLNWISFLGYDFQSYPNSQKISLSILTYPIISYHILSYPKISWNILRANSQMSTDVALLQLSSSVLCFHLLVHPLPLFAWEWTSDAAVAEFEGGISVNTKFKICLFKFQGFLKILSVVFSPEIDRRPVS